jgi:hypothetical protein
LFNIPEEDGITLEYLALKKHVVADRQSLPRHRASEDWRKRNIKTSLSITAQLPFH